MMRLADPTSVATSNLAFALRCLPGSRRAAALVFYRFCRAVDDIADDPGIPAVARKERLSEWRDALSSSQALPLELAEVLTAYDVPADLLIDIVSGCEADLAPQEFATIDDLRGYCWNVACAVGLVSIRLFGCCDPLSERYAVHLGYALQFTNILRDVGEDAAMERVYLPRALLSKHGVCVSDILSGIPPLAFANAAAEFAALAESEFAAADACLTKKDVRALAPAEIMKGIYRRLLGKIRVGGFDVLTRRYSLSKPEKLLLLSGIWLRCRVLGAT